MTTKRSTLRPGLLVTLSASVKGNCKYDKRDIERDHKTSTGSKKAKWETTRTITDPDEYENAQVAASKARSLIRSVCALSNHGLLCPLESEAELDAAIAEAEGVVDAFNASATMTRVRLYVFTGEVAQDDAKAVQRINSEVRDLIDDMVEGVRNMDVKSIRDAAASAKNVGTMLSDDAQLRIEMAIKTARDVAKAIVKAGEGAAMAIDTAAVKKITAQRSAFLDFSDETEVAVPQAKARALDLTPGE